MHDIDNALAEIADIRARMAAGTRFHGFAPEVVALTGLLALGVAGAQTLWPKTLAGDSLRYVTVWILTAVVASTALAVETLARSRRLHGPLADLMIGSTLRLFLPFGAAGAMVTFVIWRISPEAAWILPGLWQMLIALVGFASVSSLPRAIVWPAGWYFTCGTVGLVLAARDSTLSPWMMGVPFGIGQLLVAATLQRDSRHGRD